MLFAEKEHSFSLWKFQNLLTFKQQYEAVWFKLIKIQFDLKKVIFNFCYYSKDKNKSPTLLRTQGIAVSCRIKRVSNVICLVLYKLHKKFNKQYHYNWECNILVRH